MNKWDNNDQGRVTVEYGCLICRCHTDEPYYFSPETARLAFMEDDGRAVFKDNRGNFATTRRKFKSEAQIKRMAEGANS